MWGFLQHKIQKNAIMEFSTQSIELIIPWYYNYYNKAVAKYIFLHITFRYQQN